MNNVEMNREFDITLDKVASSAYPEFQDWERDFFLTEAMHRLIKTRYSRNNVHGKGFEESQKRTEDLKALVETRYCAILTNTAYAGVDNVFKADLTTMYSDLDMTVASEFDYMFYVKSKAEVSYNACVEFRNVKVVQQDDLHAIENDPFNKPSVNKPVLFFENDSIFIWAAENSVISKFMLTFIRRPLDINSGTYNGLAQPCELSEHMHKEVVQTAVEIALENIESKRVETQQVVNVQKQE